MVFFGKNRIHYPKVDSTNEELKRLFSISELENGTLLTADFQTDGKGQMGSRWNSIVGENFLGTFYLKSTFSLSEVFVLNMMVSLALRESVSEFVRGAVEIKWPNDIYFKDKKLAGILMENTLHKAKQYVLVGVGVNFKLQDQIEIDAPWTDLSKIVDKLPDFQHLTALLINNILAMSDDFQLNGLRSLKSEWDEYDMLKGVSIKVKEPSQEVQGKLDGITDQGALRVLTENGVKELFSSMHIEYI